MSSKELTESLRVIQNKCPAFGVENIELKTDIAKYKSYYYLNVQNVFYQYGYIKALNEFLFVQRFHPYKPKATILLVHGYLDHTGSLSKAIHFFTSKGFEVISYDLVGHGLSSGERVTIQRFDDYVEMQLILYESLMSGNANVYLVAHSTGAAIGLAHLEKCPNHFKKSILVAPLFRPYLWPVTSVSIDLAKNVVTSVNRVFKKNSSDENYLTFTRNDPLQDHHLPTSWVEALKQWIADSQINEVSDQRFLMIQGELDRTVDVDFGFKEVQKRYPHCTCILVEHARHQLLNEETIIREQVFSIMNTYLNTKGY